MGTPTRFVYDRLGRVTHQKTGTGLTAPTVHTVYAPGGLVTATQVYASEDIDLGTPLSLDSVQTTRTYYDVLGQVDSVVGPGSRTPAAGELRARRQHWVRNRHGVPVYEYPGNGTLLGRRTDWAGRVVYLEHGQVFPGSSVDGEPFADAATLAYYTDPLVGLSAGKTLSAGQVYHYLYDNKGRLTETTSRDRYLSGTDWQFRERRGYSRTGLVVADTFTVAFGPEVIRRYEYNRRGQRTLAADTVTAEVGTVSGDHIGRTAYLYNPSTGRLDSLLSTVVTESGATVTTAALGFSYDRGGRPTERRLWLGGSATPIVTTWLYDHVGRDSIVATVRGDSVHYRFTSDATSYSAIDELLHYTAQRTAAGKTWNYTAQYATDGTRRLTQTQNALTTGGSRTHQWSYDVFGNRVTAGYSSSIGEGTACEATGPLSYGADNRLLVKHSYPGCTRYSRYWVNQAGHRLGSTDSLQTGAAGLQSKLSYTAAGQLYYAMTPTSVAGAYDHVWHWYDAEGRRVLSKVHQANTIHHREPGPARLPRMNSLLGRASLRDAGSRAHTEARS